MSDLEVGQRIEIKNLGLREVAKQVYDYKKAPTKCPCCSKVGWVWAGWFSCDFCETVALVECGTTFIPVCHTELEEAVEVRFLR